MRDIEAAEGTFDGQQFLFKVWSQKKDVI